MSPSQQPSPLSTNEQSTPAEMEVSPSEPKMAKSPPIFVYEVTNYTQFAQFLLASGASECTRRETSSELILNTTTIDHYRKLHSILRAECSEHKNRDKFGEIQIHSYQLKSERAFIMYIRGMPRTMDPNEILIALKEVGYTPRRVVNVQRKEDGQLISRPLFRVELEPDPINPNIYELTNLLHVRITVESFKPRAGPPHCRRCQQIGHTKQYCLRNPRCIKCGGDHTSITCPLSKTDPCKCANCGGPHPANYKGCVAFQKLRKPTHTATEEIRRRELSPSPRTSNLQPLTQQRSFAQVAQTLALSSGSSSPLAPQHNYPNSSNSSATDIS